MPSSCVRCRQPLGPTEGTFCRSCLPSGYTYHLGERGWEAGPNIRFNTMIPDDAPPTVMREAKVPEPGDYMEIRDNRGLVGRVIVTRWDDDGISLLGDPHPHV
jgi:hypothetical protein